MKIAICSDLHLEFGDVVIENDQDAEVLVLSGDILVERDLDMRDRRQTELGFARKRSEAFHDFFDRMCEKFPNVIYILGNHEHYHGDFKNTHSELVRKLAHHKNLHVLERQVVTIGDVTFIGGTLWTDMNKEDPLTLHHMSSMMNDFRCVNNSNREVSFRVWVPLDKPVGMTDEEWLAKPVEQRTRPEFHSRTARFSPADAVEEHRKMLGYINSVVEGNHDRKFVVCGHHTPSHQSTHPRYKDDTIMNGGYHSDLSEFIMDRPQIKLWTHGHTHEPYDYTLGETRVVCNPRGYIGYEDCADKFTLKVVEV